MELRVKRFSELSCDELYDILQLRVAVFVVEQACAYPEVDGKDRGAYHVFFTDDSGIQAYARVLSRGVSFNDVSIGRVVARQRGCGLGEKIMRAAMETACGRLHAERIKIEAQCYAKAFYEKLGFHAVSAEFSEDGIPHVEMLWEASPSGK